MHAAQLGILAPVPGQSRYMEFGLVPEADVVPALHNLASKNVGQDIVVGVGPGLVEGLGQPIAGLTLGRSWQRSAIPVLRHCPRSMPACPFLV